MTQEEFFTELYRKEFNDKQINQMIKIYAEGYDASYLDKDVEVDHLRMIYKSLKENDEHSEAYTAGLYNKINICKFLNYVYTAERIKELINLEIYGINTDEIISPNLNDEQFKCLSDAIRKSVDISWFADYEISVEKMKIAIRLSKKEINLGADIKRFNDEQFDVLAAAHEFCKEYHPINIKFLDNPKLSHRQMQAIFNGLKAKVDVSKFADVKYNPDQMTIISNFLKDKLDITTFIDENYSAKEMYYFGEMYKYIKDKTKEILSDEFNEAQLAFLLDCVKKGIKFDKIKEVADPEYSLERMRLILNAPTNKKEMYKKKEISDEALFLYDKGYISSISNDYKLEDIKKMAYRRYSTSGKYKYSTLTPKLGENTYYTDGKKIIEITDVSNEFKSKMKEDPYDLAFGIPSGLIRTFGPQELMYILEKNKGMVSEYVDKFYYPYWDEKNEELHIVELFSHTTKKYKNPKMENLEPLKIMQSFIGTAYELYDSYTSNINYEFYDILANIGIDIDDYFITENIYDVDGRIAEIICISRDDLKKARTSFDEEITPFRAKTILEEEAHKIEAFYNQNYFIITMYDENGYVIDDDPYAYTTREIEEIIRNDFRNYEELPFCRRLSDCLTEIKKYDIDEER